jgi:hypothetical protein
MKENKYIIDAIYMIPKYFGPSASERVPDCHRSNQAIAQNEV